jgi:molecular chaperone DnaK
LDAIDTAMNALNQAWTAASEDLYKATGGAEAGAGNAGAQPGADAGGSDGASATADDVTDVEYEEVDGK